MAPVEGSVASQANPSGHKCWYRANTRPLHVTVRQLPKRNRERHGQGLLGTGAGSRRQKPEAAGRAVAWRCWTLVVLKSEVGARRGTRPLPSYRHMPMPQLRRAAKLRDKHGNASRGHWRQGAMRAC